MKQEELMLSLAKLMFPSELLDHFSLVHITETPTDVVFHLEERDVLQNPLPGHEYDKNGFYESARINDFPLRDRRVTLNVKRRRWIDRTTGKSVGNTYELTAKGTRHSKEFAEFLKKYLDQYPISARSLEKHYHIDGDQLERQYKDHLSSYREWETQEGVHAERYLIFPENIGPRLSIDETSLSDGELYTIVTNKDAHGGKGAIVAIIAGTKAWDIAEILWLIPLELREQVEEITMDLSPTMRKAARFSFPKATLVADRFHVQKLALDALQELRIRFRWDALDEENRKKSEAKAIGKDYEPEVFENGDTRKQLLARSRYLLFKSAEKWTKSQKIRAKILFSHYPDIETAYNLTHRLRMIYAKSKTKGSALPKLALWYNDVEKAGYESFKTIAETIQANYEQILNFFNNRSTNASAESFNAKIKSFRAQLRGVSDVKYFLFRLTKIYA